MKATRWAIRTVLAALLGAALVSAPVSPAAARVPQAPRAPLVLPPECVPLLRPPRITQTFLPRAWVFIANFEVPNTACLLTYSIDDPNLIEGYVSLPTCTTVGDVWMHDGRASFEGAGYIGCAVDIMAAVNGIGGSITLTDTALINGFYIYARGTLSPTVMPSNTLPNLLAGYVPTNTLRPPVALSAPISSTGEMTRALIFSDFNGTLKGLPHCAMNVTAGDQSIVMTRYNFDTKYWSDGQLRCDLPPLPRIDFAQDGGWFLIGGTPSGRNLRGTLEEIVIDPFDGGEPPAIPDGVFAARLFLPLSMR